LTTQSILKLSLKSSLWLISTALLCAPQSPWATPTVTPALEEVAPSVGQPEEGAPQLLILTGLHGYIEPCGCTIDLTLGSLERLVLEIKTLKAKGPTALLVAGGHLFEREELPSHRHAQDGAKAKLLREVLSELEVDALMPHAIDLALGESFYRSLSSERPLRDPTVNIEGGQPLLLTLGELKVGVIGLGAEGSPHPEGKRHLAPKPAAEAAAALLRAQGAQLVIALGSSPRAELRALAEQLEGIELWALAEGADELKSLSPVSGGRYLIEAGDRGRNLATLTLIEAGAEGPLTDPVGDHERKIKELSLRLKMRSRFGGFGAGAAQTQQLQSELAALRAAPPKAEGKRVLYELKPITAELPADPSTEEQVKRYQASLRELNLKSAGQPVPLPEGGAGYAKISECGLCHDAAKTFWEGTAHARAWETLERAEKTFDVECVSCHVTGFQAPGGSALGHTAGFEDVQCEACHGPSAKHAEVGGGESGTRLKVGEEVCVTCHNSLHSPSFSYPEYIKKIIGPGHGAPVEDP